MPNENTKYIVIAAALPMELAGLKKRGRFGRAGIPGVEAATGTLDGRDVALVVSGIGEERAYETARAVLSSLTASAYVSVGLSGSLNEGLKPGAVVVGESVKCACNGEVFHSDAALLSAASEAIKKGAGATFGPLYASSVVVTTSADKYRLAAETGCVALDMETCGAARGAFGAGVPFMAVRVVSDGLDDDLPVDFNRFTKDGKMDWPRFMAHVLTHPGTIPPLMRLGRRSALAAGNLADALLYILIR